MSTDQAKQEHGIKAVNQEYTQYDQVDKEQTYNLAEGAAEEEFDEETRIRTCDMSLFHHGGPEGRAQFARDIGEAMEGIGFVILENHEIPPGLYEEAERKVAEFFTATPMADKMKYEAERHGSVNQGYFPIKQTSRMHPDLVEGWVFCRRAFNLGENPDYRETDYWPAAGYEPFFRQVIQHHEKLILPLMQSILTYLGCDPTLYDEKLTRTNFGFRLNYYPPITKEDDESGAGRMLGHEDVDLFTILPSHGVDGLQVLNRENMKWIRLNPPEGSIIINTGDYMQRITNDRLPSTTHRVSKPQDASLFGSARVSIPMAVYVWEEEMLEVLPNTGEPKYEPISAVQFHTRTTSKYYGDDYAVDDD